MSQRAARLEAWVKKLVGEGTRLERASEDASFRSYLRATAGERSYIVMDAPPDREDSAPFVDVAQRLREAGLNVPEVFEWQADDGFLLLSDLGRECYFDRRNAPRQAIHALYQDALEALLRMQLEVRTEGLPDFDAHRLRAEMELFPEWLLDRHLGLSLANDDRVMLDELFARLGQACLEQPQVFVHRDFHGRNLMVCPPETFGASANPGILDFQDAVRGPLLYDLISLCRDVYVDWPAAWVREWTEWLRQAAAAARPELDIAPADFHRWFALTAAQRLIKVAGIFARLYHRDGKARYLADVPRTLSHLRSACAMAPEELGGLVEMMDALELPQRVARAAPGQAAIS